MACDDGAASSAPGQSRKRRGKKRSFRDETKRFAWRIVSHWNRDGHRISHFAVLFVFNGLTPFSFRRFLCRLTDLWNRAH
jgi:hypothetical protein